MGHDEIIETTRGAKKKAARGQGRQPVELRCSFCADLLERPPKRLMSLKDVGVLHVNCPSLTSRRQRVRMRVGQRQVATRRSGKVKMPLRLALTVGRADEGAEWPGEIVATTRERNRRHLERMPRQLLSLCFFFFAWRMVGQRRADRIRLAPVGCPQHPATNQKGEAET